MKTITFTAGRLVCRHVRYFLEKCQFKGMDVTYMESSGWIEREFTIKGPDNDINHISQALSAYAKQLNED